MNLTRKELLLITILTLTVALIICFYWLYAIYGASGLYAGLFIYTIAVGCIFVIFRDVFPKKVKCEICGSVMRKHDTKKNIYVCNHCNKEFKVDILYF